jgi:PAS domain S-box-containing protein
MAATIRVLYVDDESDLLDIGKLFLEESGDFTVTTALSASDAIRLLEQEKFDAIISDYQMPGMDGIQFLVEVRTRFGQIPFILFTGRGREEVVIQAINSGADFYLQKGGEPGAQFAELTHKVKSAIKQYSSENALQKSEIQFRAISENNQDFIMRYDKEHRHTYANPACLCAVGMTAEQFIGKTHHELGFPPDLCALWEPAIDKVFATGQPYGKTFAWTSVNGEVNLDWRLFPEKDDTGRVVSVLGVSRDISAIKAAEQSLREAQVRTATVLEGIVDTFYSLDKSWRFVIVNPAAEKAPFGRPASELLGRVIWDLYPSLVGTFIQQHYFNAAKNLSHEHYEGQSPLNGRWYEVFMQGRKRGVDVYMRDITERKQAEEALKDSRERLNLAIDGANLGLWDINIVTNVVVHNRQWTDMLGFSTDEEEMSLDWWAQRTHPDDLLHVQKSSEDHYAGRVPFFDIVFRMRHKDGSWRWVHSQGRVVSRDPDGRPLRMIGINQDVTGQKKAEQNLQKAYYEYQNLLDQIQDVYYRSDPEGNLIIASRSWATLLGYDSIDECIGKSIAQEFYANPEEREPFLEAIRRDGSVTEYDVTLKRKDGSHILVSTSSHYYYDDTRTILGVEGTFRDISKRKLAERDAKKAHEELAASYEQITATDEELRQTMEELTRQELALRESETRYREFFTTSRDSVFITSPMGRWIDFNDALMEMFGYESRKEMFEVPVPSIYANPEERPAFLDQIGRDGYVKEYPMQLKQKDGTVIDTLITTVPVRNPDGSLKVFIGTIRDVTGRKRVEEDARKTHADLEASYEEITATEEELRQTLDQLTQHERLLQESEKRYRTVFENTGTATVVLEEGGMISLANAEFVKLSGFSKDEIKEKKSWTEFVVKEDLERMHVQRRLRMQDEGKALTYYEFRFVTKSGDIRDIYLSIGVIPGTKKSIASLSDITGRKVAEESLQQANKKLTLLSSLTRHDINNQLTVLLAYLDILEHKQPDPTLTEYFLKISTAAQRISSLILFTKEYEKIGVNAPAWQDCRIIVDTAAKDAPLGKVIVKNDLPAGSEVFADPLIVKFCYNLMDNSVRYGGKITTIRFSVEERDGDHIVVCEDDGDGVVTQEKEKIFERGFGKNTGLGLALSREILSITGITIRETGESGKGARFEMAVPKGAWRMTGKGV